MYGDSDYVRFLFPRQFPRAPGRGASSSAPRFASTNRWRARATVAVPTSNAAAMASSLQPGRSFEQNARPRQFAGACLATTEQCSKVARSSALPQRIFSWACLETPLMGSIQTVPEERILIKFTLTEY